MTQSQTEHFSQEYEFDYFDNSPVGYNFSCSESFDLQSPTPNMIFSQTTFETHLEQQPDTNLLESIPLTTSSTPSTNSRERYHWSLEEEKAYKKFVEKHLPLFLGNDSKKRRKLKIFVQMSDCIGSRSESQCKSHHQKTFEKYREEFQQLLQRRLIDDEARICETIEEVMFQQLLLTYIKRHPSEDISTSIKKLIQYLKRLPANCLYTIWELLEYNQSQHIFE